MTRKWIQLVVFGSMFALAASATMGKAAAGSLKVIYAFQGGADGIGPELPLINIDGTLYGATQYGGGGSRRCEGGCGTIFSITPAGIERVLHSFRGEDGYSPSGLARVGNAIVGVSIYGSSHNIFSVTTDGKFSVLGSAGNPQWATNRRPVTKVGHISYSADYGTSLSNCASNACGSIFAITP